MSIKERRRMRYSPSTQEGFEESSPALTVARAGPLTQAFTGRTAPGRTEAQGAIHTEAQQSSIGESRDLDNESEDELSLTEGAQQTGDNERSIFGAHTPDVQPCSSADQFSGTSLDDQGMRDFGDNDGSSQLRFDPLSTA